MSPQIGAALLLAYLMGSVPSAYLVGHWTAGTDIRTLGDGNMGAKNVYHHFGLLPCLVVVIADVGKGSAAILVGQQLLFSPAAVYGMGIMAVLGHDWPVFAHFRGGQGHATSIGVLLILLPQETVISLGLTGAMLLATRHWDFSNAVGLGAIPALAWRWGRPASLVLYPIALLPTIGIKKVLDLPRARELAKK